MPVITARGDGIQAIDGSSELRRAVRLLPLACCYRVRLEAGASMASLASFSRMGARRVVTVAARTAPHVAAKVGMQTSKWGTTNAIWCPHAVRFVRPAAAQGAGRALALD